MASPRNHNGSVVGADDGRETCPSADDSDSTKPHSREPGDDVDEWRRPLLHTAAFCYAYFVLVSSTFLLCVIVVVVIVVVFC